MRVSLYEKIKARTIDIENYICIFKEIIKKDYHLRKELPVVFAKSPYRVVNSNFEDAFDEIVSAVKLDNEYDENFPSAGLDDEYDDEEKYDLDVFLDLLEFLYLLSKNLHCNLKHNDENTTGCLHLISTIEFCAERLGYTFFYNDDDDVYQVSLKNPTAEAVAVSMNDSSQKMIYKYLTIRSGQTTEKRATMKMLIDEIEGVCQKYKNIDDYNKVQNFMQCVRHAKNSPKGKVLAVQYPFYYTNEEYWLDKLFELVIGVLSFTNNKDILKELRELEKVGENNANSQ